MKTVHYGDIDGACGLADDDSDVTTFPDDVTCQRCQQTNRFLEAVAGEDLVGDPFLEDAEMDYDLDEAENLRREIARQVNSFWLEAIADDVGRKQSPGRTS